MAYPSELSVIAVHSPTEVAVVVVVVPVVPADEELSELGIEAASTVTYSVSVAEFETNTLIPHYPLDTMEKVRVPLPIPFEAVEPSAGSTQLLPEVEAYS